MRGVGFLEALALAALASVAGPAPVCSAVSLTLRYSGHAISEHPGAPYLAGTPIRRSLSAPPDLDAVQSLEIPTSASQFEALAMATIRYQDPVGGWMVDGAITSISLVPEPATLPLVALGVAILGAARKGMGRPRRPPHP
jgi:hypothetical protein